MFCKFFCCILSWPVLISFREAIMLNNEIILKVTAINIYKRNEKEIIMFKRTTYHLYFGSVQVQWQGLPIQASKWNWCGTNNKFGSPKKANLHETSLHFINIFILCVIRSYLVDALTYFGIIILYWGVFLVHTSAIIFIALKSRQTQTSER